MRSSLFDGSSTWLLDWLWLAFLVLGGLKAASFASSLTSSAISLILAAVSVSIDTSVASGRMSMTDDGVAVFLIGSALASPSDVEDGVATRWLGRDFMAFSSFSTANCISPIEKSISDDFLMVLTVVANSFKTNEAEELNVMQASLRCLLRSSGACCQTLMFPVLKVWRKYLESTEARIPENLDRSEFHFQAFTLISEFRQPSRVSMQYAQLRSDAPTFRYCFHGCRKLNRPCAGSHLAKPAYAF